MIKAVRWGIVGACLIVALAIFGTWLRGGRELAYMPPTDFGYRPDPAGVEAFLEELDEPNFSQAGADAIREAKGVDAFPYRSALKAHQALYGRPWIVERQLIGDCVSWGWAHGIYVAQCVDWDTGKLAQPPPFPSTEAIYGGSRVEARGKNGDGRSAVGGYSDGSYGGAAAKWIRDWGVVYREEVGGHNLLAYSGDRAKEWGAYGCGGEGDGGKLDAIAKRHPARYVALAKTWAEAAAALESGYPVAVCSMQGFANKRDAHGYAAASGRWAHCMCFIAVRYQKNGSPSDALLCLNSWGPRASSGPKWPDDMPDGSFWVTRSTVESMLNGKDSFAIGSVDGFEWRDIDNGAFFEPPPAEAAAAPGTFFISL